MNGIHFYGIVVMSITQGADVNQSTVDGGAGVVRRAGRPRKRVLSREKIVTEALVLLDESGPSNLTIGALARSLGVAPSAIYNHVGSKRDLLIDVQDQLIDQIDFNRFAELGWEDGIRAWARSSRDVFAAHPQLISLYAVMPVTDSRAVIAMYDAVVAGFLAAGWPNSDALSAVVAVESFILGSALDANAPRNVFDAGDLAGEYPSLATAAAHSQSNLSASRAQRAFDLGLEAVIAGLRARE